MDKIIPSNPKLVPPVSGLMNNRSKGFDEGETALIEKVLSKGVYLATFQGGNSVKVKGPVGLDVGVPVRVFCSNKVNSDYVIGNALENAWLLENEAVLALTAVLPLGFGGKGAKAKLEVYTPKEKRGINKNKLIYFIITLSTEGFGDLQWIIHLWRRIAEVQLYGGVVKKEGEIQKIIEDVEKCILRAGFTLSGPIIRIKEPFQIPQGLRLDWRG